MSSVRGRVYSLRLDQTHEPLALVQASSSQRSCTSPPKPQLLALLTVSPGMGLAGGTGQGFALRNHGLDWILIQQKGRWFLQPSNIL